MNDGLPQLQQLLRLGTARAGRPPSAMAAPLDALLPVRDDAIPQIDLWLGLATLDLWERSGFVPLDAGSARMLTPAPHERLRACPPNAEAALALLLHGAHPSVLLVQWLRQLQAHGARLPERFLPKLLDMATRQTGLRPALLPVLGERGRWLAPQQADWAWANIGDKDDLDTWDTGSLEQRIHVLRAWRARDPEAACAHLAAAWKSEPPEHRAALLPQLAVGLGMADEAFLEAALDDRRKEVRAAAQRLLASLPASQLSKRMRERLLPLLQLERPLLRAQRLQLTLPAELNASMQRDGIGAAPYRGLGEKSGWVVDLLAAIDPRFWNAHFERPPQACLALALHGDAADVLIRGWALAATRHGARDVEVRAWLHELARWWIGAEPALRATLPAEVFEALAASLHLDADDTLDALFDAFPRKWIADAALIQLLHTLAAHSLQTWSHASSRRVLRLLDTAVPALPTLAHGWYVKQLLGSLALVIDPASATDVEQAWCGAEALDGAWRSALAQFFDTVRFRHTITLSFQEQA
jgi:hypothetical protein